ncbi:phosphocarrier protein [Pseudochelatococcus contaminans]|uniref:Phosphocarrier protein n=2 Tax=Pseudochelatococcus contaminans TaxID=1538103 RepID=A0A7W5Z4P5_9HYPH|nr:phosphocarrier protein [Pseudochelatococcus contaminans]
MIDIADDSPVREGQSAVGADVMTSDSSTAEQATAAPAPRELPIVNRKGLHARASAKFVQTVDRFDAEVRVTRAGETVGGRSIMGLLTLAAAKGTSITVSATGAQAHEALDAIEALLANRFGEDE